MDAAGVLLARWVSRRAVLGQREDERARGARRSRDIEDVAELLEHREGFGRRPAHRRALDLIIGRCAVDFSRLCTGCSGSCTGNDTIDDYGEELPSPPRRSAAALCAVGVPIYDARVDLSDWLFFPLVALTLTTLLLLLLLGASVVYPRSWDVTARAAALREIERRFAGLGPRSQSDLIAADRMSGPDISASGDDGLASSVLDVVLVLTNASDRAELDTELTALRDKLEMTAVRRQVRLVANVSSIRLASYLWVAGNFLCQARFAFVGFMWFFPRALPFLGKRLQKHGGVLALIGVVVGLLWAAITRATTPKDSPFDWLSLVGNIALVFTIAGIVVAVLGLYKAILVARFGETRQWTLRGIFSAVVLMLVLLIVMILSLSGVLAEWQRHLARWTQSIDMTEGVGRWIGAALMAVFIGYVLLNIYRWIRNPAMSLSDRLWMLAGAPLLLLMLALVIFFALDISFATFDWMFLAGVWAIFVLAALAGIVTCIEWVQKYVLLKRLGRAVPKKGFRWWALVTWALSGLILNGAWPHMVSSSLDVDNSPLFVTVFSALNLLLGLWTLATFPGLIITLLYARRVWKAFEILRFDQAPPHPDLAETDSTQPE
ncbi:hypothetical protein [Luethyella okanaganae]|uniref:Uncharacterized protein n=1 Tax=Luethyella okanaganae TaxID=69372 RepID=A0ABW1VFT5_9MICO